MKIPGGNRGGDRDAPSNGLPAGVCHITTNLLHPSIMVRTGFHIALNRQGRSSVIEVVMQEKCLGHQRLSLRFRCVRGPFAQQDLRLLAQIERISPNHRIADGRAKVRALRERNFAAARHCQSAPPSGCTATDRRSPLRHPQTTRPGWEALEANSPRPIGRLVSAAVPHTHLRAVGLKGWFSSHPVLGG